MNDTSPKMAEKMWQMIQAKSPRERAQMGWSMYQTSKLLVIRAILEENPSISPSSLRKELFLRFYASDFTEPALSKILAHIEATTNLNNASLLENTF